MRIDLTLRAADGTARDVAVLGPAGTRPADVVPLLDAVLPGGRASAGEPDGPGRPLCESAVLGGLPREGAVLGGNCSSGPPSGLTATHRLEVVGGLDAGSGVPLGRTPLTIGRAAGCDLILRDPDVSRVHAEIRLTPQGPMVRDRGSANGTVVDAAVVDAAVVGERGQPVRAGSYLRLGDTYLAVTSAHSPAVLTRPGPDGTLTVNRPPRAAPGYAAEEIAVPAEPGSGHPQRIGWVAALVPAAAGVALAVSLHAPQFLLFALLSPIAIVGTALGDRLHWRGERRRLQARYRDELAASRRSIARALARESRHRRTRDPDPATIWRTARLPSVRLWERGREDAGLLRARLGLGEVASLTRVRDGDSVGAAANLRGVPVTVDLGAGPLGLSGPREVTLGEARWVIGQLVTHVGPADLELVLLLSAESEVAWRWARWLPHLRGRVAFDRDGRQAMLAELTELGERRAAHAGPDGRWLGGRLLVLVDHEGEPAQAARLAEVLCDGVRLGITALYLEVRRGGLPSACTSVAGVVGETGSRLQVSGSGVEPGRTFGQPVVADRVSERWAESLARALAPLRDPGSRREECLPQSCRLVPLLGPTTPTADSVLAGWRAAGPGLATTLGVAADGPITIDLVRDGPHALVAGTTGAGKSELLRSLVAGLAARYPPESVAFVLIDYKGGAAFADCARLPHTVGSVTDLDAHLAERALRSLERELTVREELFAGCGARDLDGYRAASPDHRLPRLIIVIDEFAELVAELDDFVSGLVGIARRGRSLGVHLVLATQRPGGVVSPEIRANTALRVCLRVTDPVESRDVMDAEGAATISRRQPGRAYLRLPGAPAVLLQTAQVSGGAASGPPEAVRVVPLDDWRRLPADTRPPGADTDLHLLVEAARAAAVRSGRPPPRSPWLAPLPDRIALGRLALGRLDSGSATGIAVGLCDLPRLQQQSPLIVDLDAGGSLLLVGGPGSGRTSAVLTLAIAAATELPPDRLHVYAIDWSGGGLDPLERLPHCGSLLGTDIAAAATLVTRLAAEVTDRRRRLSRDPGTSLPRALCVLDGWDAFATAADEHDGGRTVEALCGLLRAGPSVGLTVAITGDRGALSVRLSSCVATKLLLRLTDRADYALAGLNERSVPASLPPGRAVRASDGVEVHLAHLGADPSPAERGRCLDAALARWARHARGSPPPIRVRPLPDHVSLAELPGADSMLGDGSAPDGVVLGLGGDAGDPVVVDLFAGTGRLLVAGPPRSGRSSVLRCAFRQLVGTGCALVVAAPARSPLATLAECRSTRLVTPDDVTARAPTVENRTVLLVDDVEAFLDTPAGDWLTGWIRTAVPGLAVVAAGSSDELAACYRGIAAEVRRGRCTLLLHPGPGDADLAGVTLPRRRAGIPPGRGLLIGDPAWGSLFRTGPVPIQVAQP
ncbi:MAG: FtsK/SpoIIIE domain-containing protein [Jatrophihabitantaceae bacterium]